MPEIWLRVVDGDDEVCEVLRLNNDQYTWIKDLAKDKKHSVPRVILACFWSTMTDMMASDEKIEMALAYLINKGDIEREGDGYRVTEKGMRR